MILWCLLACVCVCVGRSAGWERKKKLNILLLLLLLQLNWLLANANVYIWYLAVYRYLLLLFFFVYRSVFFARLFLCWSLSIHLLHYCCSRRFSVCSVTRSSTFVEFSYCFQIDCFLDSCCCCCIFFLLCFVFVRWLPRLPFILLFLMVGWKFSEGLLCLWMRAYGPILSYE